MDQTLGHTGIFQMLEKEKVGQLPMPLEEVLSLQLLVVMKMKFMNLPRMKINGDLSQIFWVIQK